MATGTASGGECYATQLQAGTMWCSSHSGVSSAGSVVCLNPAAGLSSVAGGEVVATMNLRLYPSGSTAQTNTAVGVRLLACETYGLDYWAPYQAAFIAALIAITAGKLVIKRLFSHSAV